MNNHFNSLKKIVLNIRYGESVSYEVGKISAEDREELIKIVKQLSKLYHVNIHITWAERKTIMKIREVM